MTWIKPNSSTHADEFRQMEKLKQAVDEVMKLNIKSKAHGDAVIAKYAKRNGAGFGAELRQALINKLSEVKSDKRRQISRDSKTD